MDKLGAAIIGCGWVAEEYVKAFQKDERSEIRALVSRSCANAERYRDRYNLNCAIETDADKVFKRSDVDVVVEFAPGHVPGLFRLAHMERELSDVFGNHKVDLRTPEDLSRYFREDVLAQAEVQYEE